MENSLKQQIHQIIRITSKNSKTEYRGSKYAKNEVGLESGWISDAFDLREPEFYKLVIMVTCDDDSRNIYTVPIGRCNQKTSVGESKYEEKLQNALICPSESISKKEPSKISEKIIICLYIVPGATTLFYQQGNIIHVFYHPWHYHCIIWVMNMSHNILSGVSKNIFWKLRIKVGCTSTVIFFMVHHRQKTKKDSIIVLRNCIHPLHMIYFEIRLLIQLCVCY